MALLVLFAFVAGAATALSPCVLPVLPVALAAGATGGRRRPLGVIAGLVLSFTFATVALVYLLSALGLPDKLFRTLAIVVLAVAGVVLIVPAAAARVEAWLGRIASRALARVKEGGHRARGDGFGSGLLLGLSVGFVYAPCAAGRARLYLDFTASRVFLVLGARGGPHAVRVRLDGQPHGRVLVRGNRLYELVRLRHRLTLTLAPGTEAYAFTFG